MILVEEAKLIQEDRLLWKRMREGDREALAALFRRHYARLYDYGLKLSHQEELVKDGIQEVFAYIWEKRERIAKADSVRAYLLISLRRHLLKALAQQQQRQTSQQQFELEQAQDAFSPEELLIVQEQEESERQALTKALQEIPPRLREALYLKTYDGLAYREIAAIMNVSPQVARNYVSEAFHRLRLVFPT
ncbi:RNA polymerase sigma factor [candidate division KSB1 bacterium]|nr:RNA polymerase sigma factor [candidate division KSB1 bacterium]